MSTASALNFQTKRRALGLCIRCGRPHDYKPTGVRAFRCWRCSLALAAYQRARRAAK
jgi:DNA-directed RNA polymerase subunit RPC12/RpoP